MWDAYLSTVTGSPFLSAAVQFGVLGTIGEVLSTRIREGSWRSMLRPARLALKVLGWALLGVYIKWMFLTAGAGVKSLAEHGALPAVVAAPQDALETFLAAFCTSTLMNVMLGPSMVIVHRLLDIGIDRVVGLAPAGWRGVDAALLTLLWLWIPLHTFTFTQATEVRIGIAALLSLVLGVVLGWTARRTPIVCDPSAGEGRA